MKKVVAKFKGRMNAKVKQQEKLEKVEKRNIRRRELPEKFIAKILYG